MATKKSIVDAINSRVLSSKVAEYSSWHIGLTHTPTERKKEHKDDGDNVTYWLQWEADSLSDAQDIETYFINTKKMKGGTGGDLSKNKTVYVYIY